MARSYQIHGASARARDAVTLTSGPLRLALRAEKRISGADLTMPRRLGFAATSVNDQFGIRVFRAPASNPARSASSKNELEASPSA